MIFGLFQLVSQPLLAPWLSRLIEPSADWVLFDEKM